MFTPLQPRHIRLVCILPSDCPNSPLECTLVHSPLDATPPYEALSYAWGSGTVPGRPIMLDGLGLNITAELEEALRRLRPLDSSRTMWIDAICINQADLAERNAQVVLMSDIYRRADRVIAWLGEETPDSKRAITYIEEMAAWVTMANGGDASSESENEARAAILSTPKNRKDAQSRRREADRKKKEYIALCKEHLTLEQYQFQKANMLHRGHIEVGTPVLYYALSDGPFYSFFTDDRQSDWEALDNLLTLPWWSRTWIVQEVWNSTNCMIQCGDSTLNWATVRKAMNYQEGFDDMGYMVKRTERGRKEGSTGPC